MSECNDRGDANVNCTRLSSRRIGRDDRGGWGAADPSTPFRRLGPKCGHRKSAYGSCPGATTVEIRDAVRREDGASSTSKAYGPPRRREAFAKRVDNLTVGPLDRATDRPNFVNANGRTCGSTARTLESQRTLSCLWVGRSRVIATASRASNAPGEGLVVGPDGRRRTRRDRARVLGFGPNVCRSRPVFCSATRARARGLPGPARRARSPRRPRRTRGQRGRRKFGRPSCRSGARGSHLRTSVISIRRTVTADALRAPRCGRRGPHVPSDRRQ
jgi:hypothetical protein